MVRDMSAAQIIEELPRLKPVERSAVKRRLKELDAAPRPVPSPSVIEARARELAGFRRRISTGKTGVPLQQIMDEIRGDR